MSQPNPRHRTGAEISASAGRKESDLEPESKKIGKTETQSEETEIPAERNGGEDVEKAAKKSLAFKLAFIGLAASCFVFQLDATSLGIALPVSNNPLSLIPPPQTASVP